MSLLSCSCKPSALGSQGRSYHWGIVSFSLNRVFPSSVCLNVPFYVKVDRKMPESTIIGTIKMYYSMLLYYIYCCLVRVPRVVNLSLIQISASYAVMAMEIMWSIEEWLYATLRKWVRSTSRINSPHHSSTPTPFRREKTHVGIALLLDECLWSEVGWGALITPSLQESCWSYPLFIYERAGFSLVNQILCNADCYQIGKMYGLYRLTAFFFSRSVALSSCTAWFYAVRVPQLRANELSIFNRITRFKSHMLLLHSPGMISSNIFLMDYLFWRILWGI